MAHPPSPPLLCSNYPLILPLLELFCLCSEFLTGPEPAPPPSLALLGLRALHGPERHPAPVGTDPALLLPLPDAQLLHAPCRTK